MSQIAYFSMESLDYCNLTYILPELTALPEWTGLITF